MRYKLAVVIVLAFAAIAYAASQKFTYIQTNFTSGELSPKLNGRVDFPKYFNAVKTLDNFVVYPQGGITSRPGFQYIDTVKDADVAVRLIPFEFSTTQAYVLELGDQYMRFYMNGGQIQDADANTDLLLHFDGEHDSTTITDDGDTGHTPAANNQMRLVTVQQVFGSASGYFPGTNDYVSVPDHADWNFGAAAFTIDFWVRFVSLPSTADSIVIFQQYEDGNNYQMLTLEADGSDNLSFRYQVYDGGQTIEIETDTIGVAANQWYHVAVIRGWGGQVNDWQITFGGTTSATTETDADSVPDLVGPLELGIADHAAPDDLYGFIDEFRVSKGTARWTANFSPPNQPYPFDGAGGGGTATEIATPYGPEDLQSIKYAQSADTMWLVHPSHKPEKLTRTAHTSWSLSDYAPTADPFTSADNYPSAVAFFEERLCFGGSNNEPQTIWMSVSGNFDDMTTGTGADDAIEITIAADQVNAIEWMEPGRVLVVGTVGGEWKVGANTLDEPITPSNIAVRRETAYGSADVQAHTIGKQVLFVQRQGYKIREFGYNFDVDGYVSNDLNILADHILDSPVIDMAYQQEPYNIVWCVTRDGNLYSLTYERDHEVIAWASHTIKLAAQDPEVKSIAVIPGTDADEVWICVARQIDGVDADEPQNYVERMRPFYSGTDPEDAYFMDSHLVYSGSNVTSVSGLDHLEGEAVNVQCDGSSITNKTVSGGAIALGRSCSHVVAGFTVSPDVETLRIAVPTERSGTIQGKSKRISKVTVRFLETSNGVTIGPNSGVQRAFDFGNNDLLVVSGDKTIGFDQGPDTEGYIYITQARPNPCTILAIIPEVRVSE